MDYVYYVISYHSVYADGKEQNHAALHTATSNFAICPERDLYGLPNGRVRYWLFRKKKDAEAFRDHLNECFIKNGTFG